MNVRVFDCFRFYNELDLLEIRLEILWDHVDQFVLCEAVRTDSNQPKPLFFAQNKDRFQKYLSKIVHVVMEEDDFSPDRRPIPMCTQHRNFIANGLQSTDIQSDDVVLISDLDEIPNPKFFRTFELLTTGTTPMVVLAPTLYYYYFNMEHKMREFSWEENIMFGTRALLHKDLLKTTPDRVRRSVDGHIELAAGWHFSFLGNTEFIINKIKAFGHQEFNKPEYLVREEIEQRVKSGHDLFGRYYSFQPVPLDNRFPSYILENKERYKEYIVSL